MGKSVERLHWDAMIPPKTTTLMTSNFKASGKGAITNHSSVLAKSRTHIEAVDS